MSNFPRIVAGYHGCLEPMASRLLNGELDIRDWKASENTWDWLGHGIYFWESAPERASLWAEEKAKQRGGKPAVVGALIDLGDCFDLTDEQFTKLLPLAHQLLEREYGARGLTLPRNRGGADHPRRELDCLVLNTCLSKVVAGTFTAVRAPFWEGKPVYPGAMLRQRSHIQVAVRDRSCIIGTFRPNLRL
jgi:hypothetical protein